MNFVTSSPNGGIEIFLGSTLRQMNFYVMLNEGRNESNMAGGLAVSMAGPPLLFRSVG